MLTDLTHAVVYRVLVSQGAFKSVWLGYDVENGREIAWNAVNILPLSHREKKRVIMEVRILETVKNKRIIEFYGSWFNKAKQEVVFITEILRSGTLKRFIRQVRHVRLRVVRKWCKQILEGLAYLHEKDPPLIHRDLKCENIFIKGDTGDIKIGDFGLSTQVARDQKTYSILGTPEFMAPELYTEDYDQRVDIYALGMCCLEMVTQEVRLGRDASANERASDPVVGECPFPLLLLPCVLSL